jgi:signal peptidase I
MWRKMAARGLRELKPLALALAMVLIVRTVAAEPYTVPTPSMVPTLLVGDKLIASKYAYGYSRYSSPIGLMPDFKGRVLDRQPERGDVIVFRLPRDTTETYVKRVIGLPGDHVQLKDGRLYINGKLVPRKAAGTFTTDLSGRTFTLKRYIETLPGGHAHDVLEISDHEALDNTDEFVVPAGQYFMMGDNRDDSLDSRVSAEAGGVGMVPEENLIGRVDRVLYSHDPELAWWDPQNWPELFKRIRLFNAVS